MVDTEAGWEVDNEVDLTATTARVGGSSRNETRTHPGIVEGADRPRTRFARKDDVLRALRGAGRDSHTKFRSEIRKVASVVAGAFWRGDDYCDSHSTVFAGEIVVELDDIAICAVFVVGTEVSTNRARSLSRHDRVGIAVRR